MRTIKLTLEYDGTDYAGWQVQPNGVAVQEIVENALARILGQPVRLVSSGRTDAGVHARGMVAHFLTDQNLPLAAFREGVNRHLPRDIAVREAAEAPVGFHARFSAREKWYRYTLHLAAVRSPLTDRISWHLRGPLDEQAMRRAAADFVGRHDFSAFRTTGCEARTAEREIFSVTFGRQEELLMIDIRGGGFLKNMVRIMVGTLVEVGLGKRAVTDVAELLTAGKGLRAGRTAPPQGLCLMQVWY